MRMSIAAVRVRGADTSTEEKSFAPAVYGSLLVTTLVAVQWRHAADPFGISLTLITSVLVFWLAHSWAEIVDHRIKGPIGIRGAAGIAWSESSMLTAAIIPAIILTLPRLTGFDLDTAIGLALLVSLVELFLWGLAVGRTAHGTWPLALGVAVVDCALGLLVVGLKIAVIH
jgi:hypothetical protein